MQRMSAQSLAPSLEALWYLIWMNIDLDLPRWPHQKRTSVNRAKTPFGGDGFQHGPWRRVHSEVKTKVGGFARAHGEPATMLSAEWVSLITQFKGPL